MALCIIVVTSSKRTCTSSISIYTHSRSASTSSTRVITYYSRIFTCFFRRCFPRAFGVINIIVGTNSNGSFSISIIYITNSNRTIARCSITSTNSCSSTACSCISITYCSSCVICRCIFSTNSYLSIMATYIICSILVTYNDGVLTNIIILPIKTRLSVSPDINMAIIIICICHCFLWSNATHSTSYSQASQYAS